MSIFNLNQADKNQPKYLQLADAVRHFIREGYLLPGDAIPSVNSLSSDLRINRHTVMKSFVELVAEGWIESQERVGYKVVSFLPIEASQQKPLLKGNYEEGNHQEGNFKYRFVRKGVGLPNDLASSFQYNFSGGQPDINIFPFKEFKSYMSDALSRPNIKQLGYGENAGTEELISEVKTYLRKTRAVTNRDVIITNGSQEAMFIIAQLLLKAGDKVAVEALGYPPAMAVFKNEGADLVSIQQDNEGIIPEDLELNINNGNIRLIYLTPLHQYPTTVTLTVSRRMQIYQLAAKYKIPIIEDDYDHEFHYRCQPLAPMIAQDPEQLVIYVSTFSKIMFPAARVGFMALNKTLAKAVAEYRLLICHKSNVIMQSALSRWMNSGGFERHLRRTTRINLKRRDHAISLLKELNLFEFDVPDGGMALWLKIKNTAIGAKELAEKAKEYNVYIQHEGEFHTTPANNQNRYIRIGFAGMNESNFEKGMGLLTQSF